MELLSLPLLGMAKQKEQCSMLHKRNSKENPTITNGEKFDFNFNISFFSFLLFFVFTTCFLKVVCFLKRQKSIGYFNHSITVKIVNDNTIRRRC